MWETLSNGLDDGRYVSRDRCEIVARLRQVDPEALRLAAQRRLDGAAAQARPVTDEEYRRHEYEAFRDGRGDPNTDLSVDVRYPAEYGPPLKGFVARVCLVRKLRETRTLAGFTRIFPPANIDAAALPDGVLQTGRYQVQPLSVGRNLGWLPAVVVRGEGIFVEFDSSAIDSWLATGAPLWRVTSMVESYNGNRAKRLLPSRHVTPKFVLLHTLAHVLIRQLSFDCGYGSASLRERIYYEHTSASEPMQGILIYTASGDSEGTMGGLVRQGEPGRLEATFDEGLRAAAWCSSDPVCIESRGQGAENANLAACHGCVLVSETSCEEGNRLLDRGMLVGSLEEPACGLFTRRLDRA